MINLRQLAYGLFSLLPFPGAAASPATGGSDVAAYCYSVWLRHLVLAHDHGLSGVPHVVAELGPGDSIGAGLAALISGAERYFALDVQTHAFASRNLQIFDRLVELFRNRSVIPGPAQFPELKPSLNDYRFPHHILGERWLASALAPARLATIRGQLVHSGSGNGSAAVDYKVPWNEVAGPDLESVDLIFSQAVMEHVDDIDSAYRAMFDWLRPSGLASHQIDFRSHSLFSTWDGHWACPDWLWALMRGKRTYLLNRLPYGVHRRSFASNGFQIVSEQRVLTPPASRGVSRQFEGMESLDRQTSGCFVVLRKGPPSF